MSLTDSFIGKLVLTNRRLLFLSTGTSGVEKMLETGLILGPIPGLILGRTSTEEMDLSALNNEGSLSIELNQIKECIVDRRRDKAAYMSLKIDSFIGGLTSYSFMKKYGIRKKWLEKFKEDIERAKEKNNF